MVQFSGTSMQSQYKIPLCYTCSIPLLTQSISWSLVSSPARLQLIAGDSNLGKVRQIKPAQLAFTCTINIVLLTYLNIILLTYLLTYYL